MIHELVITAFKTLEEMETDIFPHVSYIGYGLETCPKTGKLHYQCFAQSHLNARTFCKITHSRARRRKGTFKENSDYCGKAGAYSFRGLFQEPPLKQQGRRSDLEDICNKIMQGATLPELNQEYPTQVFRYMKFISSYMSMFAPKKLRRQTPRSTINIYGPAGSGKTKLAYELAGDDSYRISNSDNTMWAPGYSGQKTLIIDDFDGGIKYKTLLGLTDPWYNSEIHRSSGGNVHIMDSNVIITSIRPVTAYYEETAELSRRTEIKSIADLSFVKDPELGSQPSAGPPGGNK